MRASRCLALATTKVRVNSPFEGPVYGEDRAWKRSRQGERFFKVHGNVGKLLTERMDAYRCCGDCQKCYSDGVGSHQSLRRR